MKRFQLVIESNDTASILKVITESHAFDFETKSDDMFVLVSEKYRLRTNSSQAEMVILKSANNQITVEIIGLGGGSGLLNISWGSERSFVRKMSNRITEYCDAHNIVSDKKRYE